MELSELNIVGFKSFAKKINVLLNPGITAIVGPNGCGKSNIVDSIRWVMGEQRSGVLRSERMENVIFAGSASAKPVGMAEVSLRIQNTKNILPVEYSEVVVTRRLFRSGESQYFINGNQCRLKDITSLFMDTGMGAQTYSVIELPQVEKLLNGKPEERRVIFEEAAGITKYKLRRKATFRKLEATEKDLIRVEDIMSEVEKSVRSLKRQVNKAQRYQKVSTELKDLEIKLATQEYSRILEELEPLQGKLRVIQQDREAASTELATQDAEYEALRAKLLDLEKKLSQKQTEYNNLNRDVQKYEERVLVNSERIRSLKESQTRYAQEKESLSERLAELESEFDEASFKTKNADSELARARAEYEKLNVDYHKLRTGFENKRAAAQNADAEILRITESLSRKQNEGERLKASEENKSQRLHQLNEEEKNDTGRIAALQEKLDQLRARERSIRNELEKNSKELADSTKKYEEIRRSIEGLQRADLGDKNRIEVLENKAGMIRQLLESYQDYPGGVKFLATIKDERFSSHGAVANVIRVQQQHRAAVAAALGEFATFLIVENSAQAFSGIGLLKQDRKGIVAFLPLQKLSHIRPDHPAIQDLGIVGWANEIVQTDEKFKPVIDVALDSYLIVQDLETANRVREMLDDKPVNLVTLSGEVLGFSGIIRGGSSGKRQSEIVGRQEQLDALVKEIDEINDNVNKRRLTMAQREEEALNYKTRAQVLTLETKNQQEALSNIRLELGRATFEEQSLSEARTKRKEERDKILSEINLLGRNLELQSSDTAEMQKKRQQLVGQRESLNKELETLEKQSAAANEKVQSVQVDVAKLQSEFEALQRESDSLRSQMNETTRMIDLRSLEAKKTKEEIQELTAVNESYNHQIQELSQKRDTLKALIENLKEEQYQANVKANEQEKLIRSARGKSEELSESVHHLELRASELKMQKENLKVRMLKEFEYTIERRPLDTEFDWEEAKQKTEQLYESLKRVGPVNLLALKEYEQERERFDFLQTQREDLFKARRDLTNTIDIINNTAREKFLETFEAVQKNFVQVFKSFFEGGRASIVLREGNDPLEGDIDIYATPGGKRLSSLQLLSGGEKSLTAISLLFAIYLVKPSPFCIFDEVDAPLDDRNVERFTKALKDFSQNTQFLVVTHNKLTMQAADQLYGVTMEEEGVSKVVSVKFDSAMKMEKTAPAEVAE
ncbi:MAG: chromosome segregation protein SMC [Actinobacteria bacterium]|nr:chromosome segregation protein SMC [Actinomycetota bacterium]